MSDKFLSVLETWYKTSIGKALLQSELRALSSVLPKVFGYYLMEAGLPFDSVDILSSSSVHNSIYVNSNINPSLSKLSILCNLDELPFLPESIDAILLFHELEFFENPQKIIKECLYSLINGGYLIILGFNPRSFWGISKFFKKSKQHIWSGQWLSPAKLKHYLVNIGFQVSDYQTFYFRPYSDEPNKMLFMEGMGQIFWPYCGASYMFIAQKKAMALTPLNELKTYVAPAKVDARIPKPTTRVIHENNK